jgi:hypothetical protein
MLILELGGVGSLEGDMMVSGVPGDGGGRSFLLSLSFAGPARSSGAGRGSSVDRGRPEGTVSGGGGFSALSPRVLRMW